MTQYMMSVHDDGSDPFAPDELQEVYDTVSRFNEQLQADGYWVFGGGLLPVDAATTVDATGTEVITTDGPFAESKEHLGGFWIIEAPDLDVALKLAAEASAACRGPVEVRPFDAE
jgi:hypothetical protein